MEKADLVRRMLPCGPDSHDSVRQSNEWVKFGPGFEGSRPCNVSESVEIRCCNGRHYVRLCLNKLFTNRTSRPCPDHMMQSNYINCSSQSILWSLDWLHTLAYLQINNWSRLIPQKWSFGWWRLGRNCLLESLKLRRKVSKGKSGRFQDRSDGGFASLKAIFSRARAVHLHMRLHVLQNRPEIEFILVRKFVGRLHLHLLVLHEVGWVNILQLWRFTLSSESLSYSPGLN